MSSGLWGAGFLQAGEEQALSVFSWALQVGFEPLLGVRRLPGSFYITPHCPQVLTQKSSVLREVYRNFLKSSKPGKGKEGGRGRGKCHVVQSKLKTSSLGSGAGSARPEFNMLDFTTGNFKDI